MHLKEEFDLFLASASALDLSSARLPSVGNQLSPLDPSCNTPMEYQDYWSSRKEEKICLSPLQQKNLAVQGNGNNGTLKEKWLIQICIKDLQLFPGDSFGIYPPNKQNTVETLLKRFPEQPHYVVNHVKFRADLTAFPKKGQLKFLGDACAEEKEKEFLHFLSSSKGASVYAKLREERSLGFVDFLLFFTFDCALADLLQIVPLMQPRYYSAANACASGRAVEIFFSVEPFGLATNWLPQLPVGFNLAVVHKELQLFRFPLTLKGPIIMVATGTGIAPIASFIRSFDPVACNGKELWLFYGCRTESDVVFGKEVKEVHRSFVAYSRAEPFKHVQDYILQNASQLLELMKQEKEAMIFVCGSPSMTKEVGKLFGEILEDFGEMQRQKRYRVEIY